MCRGGKCRIEMRMKQSLFVSLQTRITALILSLRQHMRMRRLFQQIFKWDQVFNVVTQMNVSVVQYQNDRSLWSTDYKYRIFPSLLHLKLDCVLIFICPPPASCQWMILFLQSILWSESSLGEFKFRFIFIEWNKHPQHPAFSIPSVKCDPLRYWDQGLQEQKYFY